MFNNLTIKAKLALITVIAMVILGVLITLLSVNKATDALTHSEYRKLSSLQVTKSNEISDYFESLKSLLYSVANSQNTKDAFTAFKDGFEKLDEEIDLDTQFIKNELKKDFSRNYLDSVNYDVPNSTQRKSIENYLPKREEALIAQYIFITNNSEKLGEKNKLVYDERFDSSYMQAHKKYHLTYDKYLNEFGLYDIFMVDLDGNLIYTDFKEKDFATNLKDEVYSNTGIGKAYKKALKLKQNQIAFEDFAPYEPSYNSAASFIATPIFINEQKQGVLIFQMPVDNINKIMSFRGEYEKAGLGSTGEVLLVGQDYFMRNNSRFTKDIDNSVVQSLNSTIGVWKIQTKAIKQAFETNSLVKEISKDKDGDLALNVSGSIDIFNTTKWAVVAKVNKNEALKEASELRNIIGIIALGIIVLCIFVILFFINRVIVKPLKIFENSLINFFDYLNNKKDDVQHLPVKSNDEIGNMSTVINTNIDLVKSGLQEQEELIANASEVINSVNYGDLSLRITNRSSNKGLEQLKELINKMLDNLDLNINNILKVLDNYSNYDYLHSVENNDLKGEIAQLIKGINNLGDSITEMLVENKNLGESLKKGSVSLQNNVEVLNTSSNEAAASLEETAAALEEITSLVVTNTNKINEMNNYTNKLTSSVQDGEKYALDTTTAMDEINEQVKAISEAILIIDNIAFQTNILSLNAAVEAATAGEAGKGFAVVAQEVRNLATRSAEAATEIKHIVEKATQKANDGKTISTNMIEGYNTLNENISKTVELINDVSSASQEQKTGVEQVNDSINLLDRQTQKNASIASETKEISNQTNSLALKIVEDTNKKEFRGK